MFTLPNDATDKQICVDILYVVTMQYQDFIVTAIKTII